MRILVVEDDPNYLKVVEDKLQRIAHVELEVARSRNSALKALENSEFDLVVCDLKIPTGDGELDTEIQHGEAVIARVQERLLGTPLIILSAFGKREFAVEAVEGAARMDIVGDGEDDVLVRYRTKDQLDQCMDEVEQFTRRLKTTDEIEIRRSGGGSNLSAQQARIIKIFARQHRGSIVQVQAVTGGLSATATFRLRITSATGQLRGLALAKIGALAIIEDEAVRFHEIVAPLPPGSFATLQRHIEGGAGPTGALFYQLAENSPSLFDILPMDPQFAAQIIHKLENELRGWFDGAPQGELEVADIRKMAGAADLGPLAGMLQGLDCAGLETRKVIVRRMMQHGDLHPGNVLVYPPDSPVLIDFGRGGEFIGGYDTITLELGLLFHPSGRAICAHWPTVEQAERWDDVDRYVENCPFGDFVRECREWTQKASPSDRAVFGSLYAQAVRQLQYPDTDKDLARALISCAIRVIG